MTAVHGLYENNQATPGQTGAAGVPRPPLLSLLVDAGVAPEAQLRLALAEGMGRGERLGEVVLRRGWIDEERLAQLLAQQWDLPFVGQDALETAVVEVAGPAVADVWRLAACVVSWRDGASAVVVAEPTSDRLNALRQLLGEQPAFAVVTPASLKLLLEQAPREPAERPTPQQPAAERSDLEDAEPDLLISQLETATGALAALRERVEQLTARRHAVERELPELRREIDRLGRQYAAAQDHVRECELELERERERHTTLREKLADLLRESD
ncbi:MAG: Type secretion system protein N-terminal domain [Gaiellaceae bacterium]|nr:Type secretion system protein N-terminal domain [Gaiellaceae bacterium]